MVGPGERRTNPHRATAELLHRAYLIYRACFQAQFLKSADADSALFRRAEAAAMELFMWATGPFDGPPESRMERDTAESCLTSVRALRAFVRECGDTGKGIYGQVCATTKLENVFGKWRGARGGGSGGGGAGSMTLQLAFTMSTAQAVEDFYAMEGAFDDHFKRVPSSVRGANVMGLVGADRELYVACEKGLVSKAAAKESVARESAPRMGAWARGLPPTAPPPPQLRIACEKNVVAYYTAAQGAGPAQATLDAFLRVSLEEPPDWSFTGLNYKELGYSVYAGLNAVAAISRAAPTGRTPVRSNTALLNTVASALRLPPGGSRRVAPLSFAPADGAAIMDVDVFPPGFSVPMRDITRTASSTEVAGNYLAAMSVLAMERAIKPSLNISTLLATRGDYARTLLETLIADAEVRRLVRAASGNAALPDHELYELVWLMCSWYVRVAWQKLDSKRVAQHYEAAKSRDAKRTGTLRAVIAAVSSAAASKPQ